MRLDLSTLHTAADVERAALALLGDPLRERPGLSQVAAVWSPDGERNAVMQVGPSSPRSDTDRFLLNLARARADAIVTTGAVLRAEPTLRFVLQGAEAPAVMRWRMEVHRLLPPSALVLSRGVDLDPEHPALRGPANVVLFVPQDQADRVRGRLRSFKWVKVVGDPEPTFERAVQWLRRERDARCISVEAGPSLTRALYGAPAGAVDELLLGRYVRPALDAAFVVGDLPPRSTLERSMERVYATRADVDGWSFERWTARKA